MYLNKVFVFGNVTRDPELKALPSGSKVCSMSLATNRVWKDKDGKKQEQADFHNIVLFNRTAELAAQYLKKGGSVFIEGRLQTRSWDGADGKKNYRTEIVAERMQFGPKAGPATNVYRAPDKDSGKPENSQDDGGGIETIDYPDDEANLEDIPF